MFRAIPYHVALATILVITTHARHCNAQIALTRVNATSYDATLYISNTAEVTRRLKASPHTFTYHNVYQPYYFNDQDSVIENDISDSDQDSLYATEHAEASASAALTIAIDESYTAISTSTVYILNHAVVPTSSTYNLGCWANSWVTASTDMDAVVDPECEGATLYATLFFSTNNPDPEGPTPYQYGSTGFGNNLDNEYPLLTATVSNSTLSAQATLSTLDIWVITGLIGQASNEDPEASPAEIWDYYYYGLDDVYYYATEATTGSSTISSSTYIRAWGDGSSASNEYTNPLESGVYHIFTAEASFTVAE